MSTQRKEFSFKGQKIFVGLDVHLKLDSNSFI